MQEGRGGVRVGGVWERGLLLLTMPVSQGTRSVVVVVVAACLTFTGWISAVMHRLKFRVVLSKILKKTTQVKITVI